MSYAWWTRKKKPKRILCFDFDGTIHSYRSGWKGPRVVPDEPIDGALEFMFNALNEGYDVVIHSSRSRYWFARFAMRRWLREHSGNLWNEGPGYLGLENVRFTLYKPPAWMTIDDRAVQFKGTFPTPREVENFKPWKIAHGSIES
jgi:hypothetical protein